jgi:cobalamin biosynthesis protein CobD/CbiB
MRWVVTADLWVAPWRRFFDSDVLADYGEVALVAITLALLLTLILLDKHSRLRLWLGLLVLVLGVKLFLDGGPIVQTVKDAVGAVPDEVARRFRR